ncbi:SGNH/GDSL hydrolase family protein [Endobacterium cereale]
MDDRDMKAARLGLGKRLKTFGTRAILVVMATMTALPEFVAPVAAQERRYYLEDRRYERPQRRTLMDLFFNDRRSRDRSVIEMQPRRKRRAAPASAPRRPVRTAPAAPVIAAEPKPEPVQKLENAKKVLVVGDFLAGRLAGGLDAAFAENPGVVVVDHGETASGLVRQDHYDWPQALPELIANEKPSLVVVMIGANDRQQIDSNDAREKFRTERWFEIYKQRVNEFGQIARDHDLPLLWVGLPAFQSASMTADAVTLNTIFRTQAEEIGGEFVDIWDGFVDEDGKFIVTGSDVNGQQVRLRSADGINMTEAGRRKLAFYVEKVIRRHLGDLPPAEMVNLDGSNLPALPVLPGTPMAAIVSTQPIALSDPDLDGGKDLLGASAPAPALSQSPRDLLVTRGELPEAPAGRVDDYRIKATQ